jgi:hypothetical protein
MNELMELSILYKAQRIILPICLLAAVSISVLLFIAHSYSPALLPDVATAVWSRDPAFIRIIAKDYLIIRGQMFEAPPIYFSAAVFWLICLISFRNPLSYLFR